MSPRSRPGPSSYAACVALLVLVHLAWGAFYVQRTSFEWDGSRVYTLWDDAMISMTYARNLARGEGLRWNPGEEPVQGYTNLGVTLVMAALHALPVPHRLLSLAFQVVNLALLAGILALVWRLARRRLGAEPATAAAAVLAVSLCAPLAFWSLQGADTGFVAFWLVASLGLLGDDDASAARFWAVAPGMVLRSDVFVLYLALLAGALAGAHARRRPLLLHGLGAFVLVWGATLLFSLLYYGDALPNTYYLKNTGMPRGVMLERGLGQLAYWGAGAVALVLAAAGAARRWRLRAARGCAAAVAAGLAYHVWVGGDWARATGGRHLVAVLPALLLLASLGARDAVDRLGFAGRRTRAALALAAAAAASLLLNPARASREWFDFRSPTLFHSYNVKNYRFASYLRDYTFPDTTVAVHWAGITPYFSERFSIDVLGKSDRHIARLKTREFRPGHSKYDWDYIVRQRQPDVIDAVSRGLEYRQDLLADYWLVISREPGFEGVDFFLRRDAADKFTDPRARIFDAPVREPPDAPGSGSAPEAPR